VGTFLMLVEQLLSCLENAEEAIRGRDYLLADDALIAAKNHASELLMYRDLSDAAGLLSLKCFQALREIKAVVDAPQSVETMRRAMQRIWAAPFMNFDEAADLASEIEDSVGGLVLVGYNEVAAELISDAYVPEDT
jgi:hypothetical protein